MEQDVGIAVEHARGRIHTLGVAFVIDARSGAQPDVHRQATLRKQLRAVADAELAAEQLHHPFGGAGVGEGAPAGGTGGRVACVEDARCFLIGESDERV